MTDTRQVLEEAFKEIHPEPSREWEAWDNARIAAQREEDKACFMRWNDWRVGKQARFTRFLDAEAWTDAALCLVPEGWLWRIMPSDTQGHWLSEVWLDDAGDCEFAARADHPALALTQAALRAKDQADG